MSTLSDSAIATYAKSAGFTGNGLVMAVAIALAESGGIVEAVGYNKNGAGQTLSVDRGLWQINNVYHAEVSDACAFSPACAASSAYRISSSGVNWNPWSTYTNGRYRSYLSRANAAVTQTGTSAGTSSPTTPPPIAPPSSTPTTGTSGIPTIQMGLLSHGEVYDPKANVVENFGGSNKSDLSAYRILLALLIIFVFIWGLAKTRAGYTAIYYAQVLILVFLFATQAQFFKEALSPLGQLSQPAGDAGSPAQPSLSAPM